MSVYLRYLIASPFQEHGTIMLVRKRAMSSRWLLQQYVLGHEPVAHVRERLHGGGVQNV